MDPEVVASSRFAHKDALRDCDRRCVVLGANDERLMVHGVKYDICFFFGGGGLHPLFLCCLVCLKSAF